MPPIDKNFENQNDYMGIFKGVGKFLDSKFNKIFSADESFANMHKTQGSFGYDQMPLNSMDSAHSANYNMAPNSVFEIKQFYNPGNDSSGSIFA